MGSGSMTCWGTCPSGWGTGRPRGLSGRGGDGYPAGPGSGLGKPGDGGTRGGGWVNLKRLGYCRSAYRGGNSPGYRSLLPRPGLPPAEDGVTLGSFTLLPLAWRCRGAGGISPVCTLPGLGVPGPSSSTGTGRIRLEAGESRRQLEQQRQELPVGESQQEFAGQPQPQPGLPPAEHTAAPEGAVHGSCSRASAVSRGLVPLRRAAGQTTGTCGVW